MTTQPNPSAKVRDLHKAIAELMRLHSRQIRDHRGDVTSVQFDFLPGDYETVLAALDPPAADEHEAPDVEYREQCRLQARINELEGLVADIQYAKLPMPAPDAEGFAVLVEKARAEMERYWLGQSSKHQLTAAIERAYAAAQPGEGWKQYAKDGESAQDVIERERADSAAFVKLYLDRTSEKSKVVDEMRHPRVQFLPKNLLLEEITRWANALTAAAPPAKREGGGT